MNQNKKSLIEKIAIFSSKNFKLILLSWLIILIGATALSKYLAPVYSNNLNLSNLETTQASNLIKKNDPTFSKYSGQIVINSPNQNIRKYQKKILLDLSQISHLSHITQVSNPFSPITPSISTNQSTIIINVDINQNPANLSQNFLNSLNNKLQNLKNEPLDVQLGGGFDQLTTPKPNDKKSESIGIVIAIIVLLISFGSILAAILPLLSSIIGIIIAVGIVGIVAKFITFSTDASTLAIMLGLGVGIDYILFLITRFRQQLIDHQTTLDAIAYTARTSGKSIVVAGTTVIIALLGLYATGITFIGKLGLAAVFGVLVAMLASLTLTPASLALIGQKIDRFKVRKTVAENTKNQKNNWQKYAELVSRQPLIFLIVGLIITVVLALPIFSLRLGFVDNGSAYPSSYSATKSYNLIQQNFGVGYNGPFTIVIKTNHSHQNLKSLNQQLQKSFLNIYDVKSISPFKPTANHQLLIASLIPNSSPQSQSTTNLFNNLINHNQLNNLLKPYKLSGYVTGQSPSYIDFSNQISQSLPIVIILVVVLAFILILASFRSLILACQAAILNLLSISAAYGVLVAVFQFGYGRSLIGLNHNVPIESYVPVIMFAIIFGLSMDYEIFLLTRIKGAWRQDKNTNQAVIFGLSSTGRLITSAALIMATVFIAFVSSNDIVIKMLSIGLSSSVLIDATVVRLMLVPSIIFLLKDKSWYMPKFINKILPDINL